MPSDIEPTQIIFRKTPEAWHPYIKLARLDRPIGIWLLLFPCWWSIILAAGGFTNFSFGTLKTMLLFGAGAVLMRAAGCIINDLWDRHLDAQVDRTKTRPLAAGDISTDHAIRFLAALLGLSLAILITLPLMTIILGVLSLPLVVAYPKMKRLTWWPQLFLGLTFNWGALMGWSAVTHKIGSPSLLLYVGGIFWTLGYDTLYAHQDKNDDALIGVKSTALLLGDKSRTFIAICYALSLAFLITAKYFTAPNILTPMLTGFAAAQAVWQWKVWDMNDTLSCLRVFKSNQAYGWLVLLMLAV